NGDLPVPDLRTMEELCQPSLNGRGGPITPIAIQATKFGLKNDMIQQAHNSCQFHGLSGDDAKTHLDKFLHVTQSIKVNGMAKMFLGKYFPPSMVTKLINEINNFRQRPDESLFEAWEHYKLSIDRCPNHNMLPVTQTNIFYNGLTLRHRDTINAAAVGTFMKSESSSSITSSSDTKIAALKAEMAEINKNLMRVLQVNQRVKAVTPNCETCGGPHSFSDCPTTVGNTQNVYAVGAYQGQNQPPAYQAPAYQAPVYQAPVHQPQIPQPQVVTTNEFTNFMKANDAILKNMQTNMNSLTNLNLKLKNMFGQLMKMNTASSLGSRTLPGNTITNPKEDLKGITTRSGIVYPGPTIPTTSYSSPIVERETEVTKDTVHPTNNESTEDVQPSVVPTESLILNSEQVNSLIIEPVASPVSASRPNQRPLIPYPSRLQDQKLCDKANDQRDKFFQIFKDLNFNISLADALILIPKFGSSIKSLLTNKDKLYFDADPRVPLILRRYFLKTGKALIDVFEGELTIRVGKEAITFNLDQILRYLANYNDMTANRIDIIDMACEEYSQEVLGFFRCDRNDFLLEEVDAFLAIEDDPTSPEIDKSYVDIEGDTTIVTDMIKGIKSKQNRTKPSTKRKAWKSQKSKAKKKVKPDKVKAKRIKKSKEIKLRG
nr:hypothetical protein [Tanacetum cinerariifolium]